MKTSLSVITLLLVCALLACGQSNYLAVGASYQPGGSPAWAASALYARQANSAGTHAYAMYDSLPLSTKPVQFENNVGVGVAQRMLQINSVSFYVPAAAGPSWTGTNIGWQWTTGVLAVKPLKESWSFATGLRMVKSSVNANAGYGVIGSLMIGWSW